VPTVKEILEMVEEKDINTASLRTRWANDLALWNLEPYTGAGTGYKNFTSNEPGTNGQKGISMLAGAKIMLQVPQMNSEGGDDRDARDADNDKEKFLRGSFKANDERLVNNNQQTLQQALAFGLTIRGTTCGRALLRRRNGNGRPIADATPFDASECFWEFGADGLLWFCHRYSSLRKAAERDWNIDKTDKPEHQVLTFFDWYDGEKNMVVTDAQDKALKDEPHGVVDGDGEPRVPAWVNANTIAPLIAAQGLQDNANLTESQLNDAMKNFGESIYKNSRHTFEQSQFVASMRLELAARSRKPVFSIESESGVKVVEYDPFKEGAEIPLKIGEKLIVHDMLATAPDTDPLAGMIANEEQKALFPAVSFGNLADPISGFAITNLKSGTADKVMHSAQAASSAYMTIGNIWADHFATGAFGGMELSGIGRNRKWFSAQIEPEKIRDLPQAEIELVPELPEDQAATVAIAQQYRQPSPTTGLPLKPDWWINENVLHAEDSDMDTDQILAEGAAANPLIRASRTMEALQKRGDIDGAKWALVEFQMKMAELINILRQQGLSLNPESGEITPSPTPQGNTGFPPQVLPNAGQGRQPPQPGIDTPFQNGRNVPLGTERPGAQNGTPGVF